MFTPNKRPFTPSKVTRKKLKHFPFLNNTPDRPQKHTNADKQNIAKDDLIQLGKQSIFRPIINAKSSQKINSIGLGSWIAKEPNFQNQSKTRNQISIFALAPNARLATTSVIPTIKQEDECNTVEKLKMALKNLQSPEKNKYRKGLSQARGELLESLMSRRKAEPRVSDLIRLREMQSQKPGPVQQVNRKICSSIGYRSERPSSRSKITHEQNINLNSLRESVNSCYGVVKKTRAIYNQFQ